MRPVGHCGLNRETQLLKYGVRDTLGALLCPYTLPQQAMNLCKNSHQTLLVQVEGGSMRVALLRHDAVFARVAVTRNLVSSSLTGHAPTQ